MVWTPQDARNARAKAPQWVTPASLNGATNVGGGYQGVRYCKLPNGLVCIQGWVTVSNTTLTTMFTLPAGYRPAANQALTVGKLAGGAYGTSGLEVMASGAVRYPAGLASGNALYLTGINFPADA